MGHKRGSDTYQLEKSLNFGLYDTGEQCGPWASCVYYTYDDVYIQKVLQNPKNKREGRKGEGKEMGQRKGEGLLCKFLYCYIKYVVW
jgi:hypothetical protein